MDVLHQHINSAAFTVTFVMSDFFQIIPPKKQILIISLFLRFAVIYSISARTINQRCKKYLEGVTKSKTALTKSSQWNHISHKFNNLFEIRIG